MNLPAASSVVFLMDLQMFFFAASGGEFNPERLTGMNPLKG
ncbi:MAG TPA: hypothetical protein PLB96_03100 [Syntrophales bacterium]|nr:hypothetical protein [Syntrophales bacterium]